MVQALEAIQLFCQGHPVEGFKRQQLADRIDSTLWVAGATNFSGSSALQATVAGVGVLSPDGLGSNFWAEYGARVGYRVTEVTTIDAFVNGVSGDGDVGTRAHAGGAIRFQF